MTDIKITGANSETIDQFKSRTEQGSRSQSGVPLTPSARTTIDEKLRREQIENDNAIKDQELKVNTLRKLFVFLGLETCVIFALAFMQGLRSWGFHLDDWSFRLVISATILQITAMLTIAVQHLFPRKR